MEKDIKMNFLMSHAYDVTVLTDCCSAKSEEVAMS